MQIYHPGKNKRSILYECQVIFRQLKPRFEPVFAYSGGILKLDHSSPRSLSDIFVRLNLTSILTVGSSRSFQINSIHQKKKNPAQFLASLSNFNQTNEIECSIKHFNLNQKQSFTIACKIEFR